MERDERGRGGGDLQHLGEGGGGGDLVLLSGSAAPVLGVRVGDLALLHLPAESSRYGRVRGSSVADPKLKFRIRFRIQIRPEVSFRIGIRIRIPGF
jgi:hypothetical protein